MENFKIESRYLKLCNELRAVIRCMKAAFYRSDYQKLLMCRLIKRLGRSFVSKHAAEPLKGAAEILKYLAELTLCAFKSNINKLVIIIIIIIIIERTVQRNNRFLDTKLPLLYFLSQSNSSYFSRK